MRYAHPLALAVALSTAMPSQATDYSWNTTIAGTTWNTASSWTPTGGPPGAADNATLGTLSGAYTATLNTNQSITNLTIDASNATLTQSGGSLTSSGTVAVNSGTYNLNSGTLTVNGSLTTGAGANVNWAGGTLTGSGTLNGTITVTGGGSVTGTTLTNAGTINWQAGTITAPGTISQLTNSGTIDFKADGVAFGTSAGGNGTLVNTGTLVKSGGNASNSNTNIAWVTQNSGLIDGQIGTLAFTNGTLVNNGIVNAGNGATISATLTSGENGLVRGVAQATGNYTGNQTFNSGSTLAAGGTGAAGRLILTGNLTMNNESTFHVNLNGTTHTTGFDRVQVVNGTVTLNNATLDGAIGAGFAPTAGQNLFVLVNDGTDTITNTFNGLAQNGTGTLGGWNFQISYLGNFDNGNLTGGNDIVLYNFSPVPEPASVLAIAVVGMGAIGITRRWRRGVVPTQY